MHEKKKRGRRTDPNPVLSVPRTAEEIGNIIGTEQPLRATPAPPLSAAGFGLTISNCTFIGCRQAIVANGGSVHVIASELDGDVIAGGGAHVVLDARTSVSHRSELILG